jgi:hypothetical protein
VLDANQYIPIGDPRRAQLGRGVALTLLAAILFVGSTVGVKDVRFLSAAAPWGEDPYDAFFSFAIFFVGLVAVICIVRYVLCRRSEPLPIVRIVDLVHGCRVILVSTLVTLATGWISLALSPSALASPTVALLTAVLAIETLMTVSAAVGLWMGTRDLALATPGPYATEDWFTDAVDLGTRLADRSRVGRTLGLRLVRAADQRLVVAIRRHRLRAALVLALAFGAFIGLGAGIEQDPPLLVALLVLIGAGGMLAFLVTVGSYLGLARGPSRYERPTVVVRAAILAAASLPVVVAFRDGLWWIVGSNPSDARLEQLAALLTTGAAATFVLALVVQLAAHRIVGR